MIKFSHFKTLITSHNYYVWNEHNDSEDFSLENKILQNKSWLTDVDPLEIDNYPQVIAQTYEYVRKKFYENIIKFKDAYYIKSKTLEDKLKETIEYIQNPKFDFLIGGVVKYRNAIAYIDLYDSKNKIVYFLKPSTSTKAKDILSIFWTTQLMIKNNIKISDIKHATIAIKDYKKNEIDFFISSKINTNKSGRKRDKYHKKYDYEHIQEKKTGNFIDINGKQDELYTIYEIVVKGHPINIGKKTINRKLLLDDQDDLNNNLFYFLNINKYIDQILEAQEAIPPTGITSDDFSIFSDSKYAKSTISKEHPLLSQLSGSIIKAKDFLSPSKIEDTKYLDIFKYIFKDKKIRIFDCDEIKKTIAILNKNVIWYDFEGYSLPFAPLDNFMPYQQIVFQCSIIRTKYGELSKTKNIVLDPKNIDVNDYFEIIKAIYAHKATAYVVYNKSYENTRLDEMIRALSFARNKFTDDAISMVNFIKERTIDLADFFITYRNKLPTVLIPELYGYYSIKKIEKYITSKKLKLKTMIQSYEELEIQNGSMAMMKAISRSINVMGDNEWNQTTNELKIYCENDVKAMIMIKEFLEYLIYKFDY